MDLHREQQQEVMEISSEEEEKKKETSREVYKMWETVQKFVEKHHPSKAVAVRAMNLFNDNAMSLERFLVKVAQKEKESTDSSDSVSDIESCPNN
jgi:hypothetical protein